MSRVAWAAAGIAMLAAAAPPALAAPAYMGGSLPEAAVTGAAYTPTVGVTLEPRAGGKVRLAFDTTLRCGRSVAQIRVARVVAWDGANLAASGEKRRFAWTAQAHTEGQTATGSIRISATHNGRPCRGRGPRGVG